MLLQTTTLSDQDITSALLAGTYTATVEVDDLSIEVILDQIAGDGNYTAYITRQIGGVGSEYKSTEKTRAVAAGVTSIWFSTIQVGASAGDVIKVYVTGLPADDTTPDVTCEFWGNPGIAAGTPASGYLYASLADFKAWIATRGLSGATGTDVSDDSVISALLLSASHYIDHETNRRFWTTGADETRYYTAETSMWCVIDDCCSLTSVAVDTNNDRNYTVFTTYETTPDNAALDGIPFLGLEIAPSSTVYFPTHRKGVQVIGKFGYSTVPPDIKEACLLIADSVYGSRSGQTSNGKISITAAGIVIKPEDVPTLAQAIINNNLRDIRY